MLPRSAPPQMTMAPLPSFTDTSLGPPVVTPRTCRATRRGSSASTPAAARTAGLPSNVPESVFTVSSGRPSGRLVTSRTFTPKASTRAYPPCTGRANRGCRSWTVITSVLGQSLLTCADCTCLSCATRRAIAPVLTRMSGWPRATCAAASTWPAETALPLPATWTERTTSSLEPSSAQASTPTMSSGPGAKTPASRRRRAGPRAPPAPPPRPVPRRLRFPGRGPPPAPRPVCPGCGGPDTVLAIRRLPTLPQCRYDRRPERRHVPGAHGQDKVTRPGGIRPGRPQARAIGHEARPPARHRPRDKLPGDPRLGILAGRVHVEHERLVGQAERGAQLRREDPRPAEQVRLEHREDPAARPDLAGCPQVGGQFGGVVRVTVKHQHPGRLPLRLQPTVHAPVCGQPGRGQPRAQPEFQCGGVG